MEKEATADSPNELSASELPHVDWLDYLLFVPMALYFFLILLVFEIAQRIGLAISQDGHTKAVLGLNWSLLSTLKVVGAKVLVTGKPNLDPQKLYVVVSNHQSLFDVCSLHCIFGKWGPRFIAKKELAGYIPSVSYNLNHGLNAVIDRSDREQAVSEIKKLAERMKQHRFPTVIFPEGTRSRTGKLRRFHSVGLLALLHDLPEAEIITATIDGSWKLQAHRRGPVPRGATIQIHLEEPLRPDQFSSLKEMVRTAEKTIAKNLELMRQNPGQFGKPWRLM